ncbi:MAG: hypothetical protein KVP17_003097 [Porospora cf. gigantea B]|uniref:uncharacterized protein n=1 Tax=Porospora cf. gigantea B TaxID=2853592 RepID=UPI003571E5C3|nr:MAG: hypothetical protein KVP17_003097 [Porospora cf. gigantea B]
MRSSLLLWFHTCWARHLRTLVFREAKLDLGRISRQLQQPTVRVDSLFAARNAIRQGDNELLTRELTDRFAEAVQAVVREVQSRLEAGEPLTEETKAIVNLYMDSFPRSASHCDDVLSTGAQRLFDAVRRRCSY